MVIADPPTFKTRSVEVTAEIFDGSIPMAEKYGLKFGRVLGHGECWWSERTGVVKVGEWIVTHPAGIYLVLPEARFAATYVLAEQALEDRRDLALRVAGDRIRELEHELAQMQDQARRAREELRATTEAPPPPDPYTVDWYSCVICSRKTDEPPPKQVVHACCLGMARVGPCCERAVRLSPFVVGDVLAASNHRHDCKGPR